MRKKTHEEYVKELSTKNPDIEALEEYVNNKVPILHCCKVDGYLWKAAPGHILSGTGCPKCANNARKTTDDYMADAFAINPNIEVLGTYINAITPILHRCKIDGNIWMAVPNNVLRGSGCPKCAGILKKTTEQYIQELLIINPNMIVVGEYVDAKTPIEHYCKKHKIYYAASPNNVLHGEGCYECGKEKISNKLCKIHDDYVNELLIVNPNIEVLEQYVNSKTQILHRCKIDGNEWYAAPGCVLSGTGCPQCNVSRGERQIRKWLDEHDVQYVPQKTFVDCKNKNKLPFDFYLPAYNACIEYDGEQHFRSIDFFGGEEGFKQRKYNDETKTKYCEENNIHLLRIPYFKNVNESLESFIHLI